jgi:hypothetical protein
MVYLTNSTIPTSVEKELRLWLAVFCDIYAAYFTELEI